MAKKRSRGHPTSEVLDKSLVNPKKMIPGKFRPIFDLGLTFSTHKWFFRYKVCLVRFKEIANLIAFHETYKYIRALLFLGL